MITITFFGTQTDRQPEGGVYKYIVYMILVHNALYAVFDNSCNISSLSHMLI